MANAFGPSNLQGQYNSLSDQLARLAASGMQGTQMYRDAQAQRDRMILPMQTSAAGSAGAGAGIGGVGTAASNWQNALDMTRGRGDAVMNDPYTKAALDRLNGVVNGSQVPYTQAVQNQLLARQADANSASTASQAGMLRDQMAAMGGSMADPQAQAAMRQLMAQQQQTNNANLGDMNTQATLQNFNAQQQAAMNLGAMRGSQLGMANGQYNQAGQMYANRQLAGQHQNAVSNVQPPQANYNQQGGKTDYERQMEAYQQSLKAWKDAQQGQQQGNGQPAMTAQSGGAQSGGYANSNGYSSSGNGLYTQGTSYGTTNVVPLPRMQVGGSGNWTGYNQNLPVY